MSPELAVIILSVLMFVTVIAGVANLANVNSFGSQKEEAERILRRRFLDGEEKTLLELKKFFSKIRRSISFAAFGFTSAFILSIAISKRLWPSDSVLKTIISLGILLVIFVGPLLMLILADNKLIFLKQDIMGRFNEE